MTPAITGTLDEMLKELRAYEVQQDAFEVKPMNEWLEGAKIKFYEKKIHSSNKRKPISKSKRYKILHRDNFTCQACGRNPKEDGVKLEIDHIIPVSKGGLNNFDNLQVLCRDCNRGKSDKVFH